MEITAEMIFEVAVPLGDRWNTRDVKREAVRRVMIEHWSVRKAAREIGAKPQTIAKWIRETETRLRLAHEEPSPMPALLRDD
jgi:transposase-like protein